MGKDWSFGRWIRTILIKSMSANIDYKKACNHIMHIDHNGKIEGIHTYNCSAHYEIIDFMIFNELPVYYKLYYFLGNRIFKIITKIERFIKS